MNKFQYNLESLYDGKWLVVREDFPLKYLQGYLDCLENYIPRLHSRIIRSDGKIMEEITEYKDVSLGMVTGFPTAEHYESAAERAITRANEIRRYGNYGKCYK